MRQLELFQVGWQEHVAGQVGQEVVAQVKGVQAAADKMIRSESPIHCKHGGKTLVLMGICLLSLL